MCFCLGLGLWTPYLVPRLRAKYLREDHPKALFSRTKEQSAPLAGTAGESACKPALETAGEVFQRERTVSVQRPHRSEAEPSTAPALGLPGPDIPGLQWYCPMKG